MAEFKNFSFRNVNVIYGTTEIKGFAEGDDVVNIEWDADQFTKVVGAKGDVTRTQTSDNSGTITIKLLETSSSNKLLTALYNADKLSGAGVQPMIVSNYESGEVYVGANAWIMKYPTVTKGQAANVKEWVFQADDITAVEI